MPCGGWGRPGGRAPGSYVAARLSMHCNKSERLQLSGCRGDRSGRRMTHTHTLPAPLCRKGNAQLAFPCPTFPHGARREVETELHELGATLVTTQEVSYPKKKILHPILHCEASNKVHGVGTAQCNQAALPAAARSSVQGCHSPLPARACQPCWATLGAQIKDPAVCRESWALAAEAFSGACRRAAPRTHVRPHACTLETTPHRPSPFHPFRPFLPSSALPPESSLHRPSLGRPPGPHRI